MQSEFEDEEYRIRRSCAVEVEAANRKVEEALGHVEVVEAEAAAAKQAADEAHQKADQMQRENREWHFDLLEASCRAAHDSAVVELEGETQREELTGVKKSLEHVQGLKEAAENLLADTRLANQVEREGAFALYAQQESHLETAKEELAAARQREQDALSEKTEQENLVESLQADICAMAAQGDALRDDSRRAKQKVKKELEAKIASLEETLEVRELQVTVLECNADTDKAIIEARDLQIASLDEAVRSMRRERDASQAGMEEAQDKVEQACTVEELLSAQVATQRKELAKANIDVYRLTQELEKSQSLKDLAEKTLSRDRRELGERITQLTQDHEASDQAATLQCELDKARQELAESTADRAVLVRELDKVAWQRGEELEEFRAEREGAREGLDATIAALRKEWERTQRDLCLKHDSHVRHIEAKVTVSEASKASVEKRCEALKREKASLSAMLESAQRRFDQESEKKTVVKQGPGCSFQQKLAEEMAQAAAQSLAAGVKATTAAMVECGTQMGEGTPAEENKESQKEAINALKQALKESLAREKKATTIAKDKVKQLLRVQKGQREEREENKQKINALEARFYGTEGIPIEAALQECASPKGQAKRYNLNLNPLRSPSMSSVTPRSYLASPSLDSLRSPSITPSMA